MENSKKIPLAERMRPQTLDEVVGQKHLIGEGGILRKIVENREPVSLIFWGPAGTGKTTLSRIIAHEIEADFIEISAVTSGKKDIERVVERARQNWNLGIRTVLFVDEIHRFNKSQQDAFLPHIESGLISLIGATTENPAFEIINPLISRSRVLTLKSLKPAEIAEIIQNTLSKVAPKTQIEDDALALLSKISSGDARTALGNLELILAFEKQKITVESVKNSIENSNLIYDKKGDVHYDTISAFIKSMRGGDAAAAGFYLARMLKSGEDPKFIARRMLIFASEDIGLAGNGAITLANSAFEAVEKIGMPEAKYVLFHCAVALTKSKKSRETTGIMYQSYDLVEKFPHAEVPLHLRNSTSKITEELGYTEGYEWKAGFQHEKGFLPQEVLDFRKAKNPDFEKLKQAEWSQEIDKKLKN
ncbi:MAG: replication-associated recombination protein A [bacterium]|nr:replication-associated recombination protein A [bacterium]